MRTDGYYLRRVALLLRRPRSGSSLFINLNNLESWAPEAAPVEDAGLKLARHIRKNYVR